MQIYDVEKFAQKLRHLMALRGWKQSHLSREAKVPASTLSKIMGGATPGVDIALSLARALGTTVDYLADDDADEPPTVAPEPQLSPDDVVRLTLARRYPLDVLVDLLAPMQPGYLSPPREE